MTSLTRREWTVGILGAASLPAATPNQVIVESHLHLFARDQARFPYHPNAVYRPPAQPVAEYVQFAVKAGIDHAVIVHPEPYQDDHRYLKHCIENEPSRNFFKGTCLLDPIAADTPSRMKQLTRELPSRIVALRIHNTEAKDYPSKSAAIRDRDLSAPEMARTWRAAHDLGLAIQMHMIPRYAPQVRKLVSQVRDMMVIIDHLSRAGQGTAAEFDEVLRLSEFPRTYMKFSGVNYSSKQEYPFSDVRPVVEKAFKAFGPDRIIWGTLGMNATEFEKNSKLLDSMFRFASEGDRAKIRGLNAVKLFRF
jgi:predicted TIM-barrel fold metal-dependent hydrolase